MVKHTQTIRRQQPTNCLSLFDHFVGLALKGLSNSFVNQILRSRTSRLIVFCKKGVLKDFTKFTGKTPVAESLFDKAVG